MKLKGPWAPAGIGALLIIGLATGSCSDGGTGPADPDPDAFDPGQTPVVVSEPISNEPFVLQSIQGGAWRIGAPPSANGAEGVTYISYAPGSVPGADSILVKNMNRDVQAGARMVDGGLDPIAIPASIGDSLLIDLFSGAVLLTEDYAIVPEEDPPRVVRTSPLASLFIRYLKARTQRISDC